MQGDPLGAMFSVVAFPHPSLLSAFVWGRVDCFPSARLQRYLSDICPLLNASILAKQFWTRYCMRSEDRMFLLQLDIL